MFYLLYKYNQDCKRDCLSAVISRRKTAEIEKRIMHTWNKMRRLTACLQGNADIRL